MKFARYLQWVGVKLLGFGIVATIRMSSFRLWFGWFWSWFGFLVLDVLERLDGEFDAFFLHFLVLHAQGMEILSSITEFLLLHSYTNETQSRENPC